MLVSAKKHVGNGTFLQTKKELFQLDGTSLISNNNKKILVRKMGKR